MKSYKSAPAAKKNSSGPKRRAAGKSGKSRLATGRPAKRVAGNVR